MKKEDFDIKKLEVEFYLRVGEIFAITLLTVAIAFSTVAPYTLTSVIEEYPLQLYAFVVFLIMIALYVMIYCINRAEKGLKNLKSSKVKRNKKEK